MQFERRSRNYRHIVSNVIYITFEKLLFEIAERVDAIFESPAAPMVLSVIESPGFRNAEENGFDDLHINYLNERLLVYYMETLVSVEKVDLSAPL